MALLLAHERGLRVDVRDTEPQPFHFSFCIPLRYHADLVAGDWLHLVYTRPGGNLR